MLANDAKVLHAELATETVVSVVLKPNMVIKRGQIKANKVI